MKVVRGSEFVFEPASHEDPKDPGVWKKVLATQTDFLSGQIQMLNWALLKVGKSFQRHYHEDMQEVFVILQGRVSARVEDGSRQDTVELDAGDLIIVEPLEVHSMANAGELDVVYIVFGISRGTGGRTVVVE